KAACPGALISGGVSNVSFSFRGNDYVREAMHAAFLYHAIQAGMDMGIVNAGQLMVYAEIPETLLTCIEDVLFNRRPDATERLVTLAESYQQHKGEKVVSEQAWRSESLERRLAHALRQGVSDYLEADLKEALESYSPLGIIEGPLMDGMNEIGDLFGAGKMFLPQVVKSARVMKQAVAFLQPLMTGTASAASKGRILMATVKGDVHDIGKNIVGVVLGCNHYEVIDLGVMVPATKILAEARRLEVDAIGLSGLITPSLDEMVHVAKEMEREGFRLPLLIGGATTSRKHTAVRIAPAYSRPVAHVQDASRAVGALREILAPDTGYAARLQAEQQQLRERYESDQKNRNLLPLDKAREKKPAYDWPRAEIAEPEFTGVRQLELSVAELIPYIDWTPFFSTWELPGVYPRILEDSKVGPTARELFEQAQDMLATIIEQGWLAPKARYGFFPANSFGDDILLNHHGVETPVHFLRQQEPRKDGVQLCLADWLVPRASGKQDYLGAFVLTAGSGIEAPLARFAAEHDDFSAILLKALADRLAEALAERVHQQVRREWGYGKDEAYTPAELIKEPYRGIRPAPGYPACPDHTEKRTLFALLQAEKIGVSLTEQCAMYPAASVSGWYFAHPDSRYFSLGKIAADQLADYAKRKAWSLQEAETWLRPWLA
ncbi:MAG: vitamin B12 dependent-methionine synthase activation domain-containing protein, partial [Candidatus Sericytochromatia bacterium]